MVDNIKKLTIIIPAFNEEKTIKGILDKVILVELNYNMIKEIIVVDDCSIDNTLQELENYIKKSDGINIQVITHNVNKGKGAAIHSGIAKASGDYIIVQDADLEYDPEEYNIMLEPVVKAGADVVYGSRFAGGNPHRILFFWHTIGNRFLTFLSNMFSNLNLTDMESCYKLFKREIIQNMKLKEKRFGFEPEVTQKISKIKGIKIYEVGISYYGRTYEEGKKINWKDGLKALYCIIKYGL